MVGIYGTIGTSNEFDKVNEHFFFTGDEHSTKYEDKDRGIHATFHDKKEARSQPTEAKNIHLFIWGEICGYGDFNNYESMKDIAGKLTDAQYCGRLYQKHGIDFIKKLNSNFAGVIFNNETSKTHIFTDRLGSRPIYYTKTSNNSLIFSTSLQAVARHSDYDIRFDKDFLCQYLTIYRVLGVYTPLKDIKKLHPGSILTFDHKNGKITQRVYWKPEYKPLDKNFQFLVDWLSKILDDVMGDRLEKDRDYGLLLSGGADSRIIANYLEGETVFHMNETFNDDAKIAKKVAKLTGNKFEFLKREKNYLPKSLSAVAPLMNFNSTFVYATSIGFWKEFTKLDTIICGQYADTLLLGNSLPSEKISLPFIRASEKLLRNPFPKIKNVKTFINYVNQHNPKYINFDFELKKSVFIDNDKAELNGISYQNLENLSHYGLVYPITNKNSILFYEGLNQNIETSYPFLDNRIIEFSQYLLAKYKLKRDIVKNVLHQKNKNLSKIIIPATLQPAYRHRFIHRLAAFFQLNLNIVKNHMDVGSWPNYTEIMKETGYAEKIINENKKLFNDFDFLDFDETLKMVKKEKSYPDQSQIHSLLSFFKIYNKIIL